MAILQSSITVHFTHFTPQMLRMLSVLQEIASTEDRDITITSACDGNHNPGSQHPKGTALDIRTRDRSPSEVALLKQKLEYRLGPAFTVLLEGPAATPETSGPHLHLQLKRIQPQT